MPPTPPTPPNRNPVPVFIHRPEPLIQIREGDAILLRCELDRKMPSQTWLKDLMPLFLPNMSRADGVPDRFTFVGDLDKGDYTIELKSATLNDNGQYQCQVAPKEFNSYDNLDDFRIVTNLSVLPLPAPVVVQSGASSQLDALASGASQLADTATDNNNNNNNNNNDHDNNNSRLTTTNKSPPEPSSPRNGPSQLLARDISPTWTKLSSTPGFISASLQPSAFVHSHPSTSSSAYSTLRASSAPAPANGQPLTLMLTWPYLLLALAGLLMLANIYLIYSLIKRHTGCAADSSKEQEVESGCNREQQQQQLQQQQQADMTSSRARALAEWGINRTTISARLDLGAERFHLNEHEKTRAPSALRMDSGQQEYQCQREYQCE